MNPEPRAREALFTVQILANIVILALVVALLFTTVINFARITSEQTAANRQLIAHLQRIFVVHATSSTRQNCAVAQEVAFLVGASPQVPPQLLLRLPRFVHEACQVELVPPLQGGSSPGSAPSASGSPTTSPRVSGSPQPSDGPTPTSSPSPSPICLPGIGCL